MPLSTAFSGGVATGDSIALRLQLPNIVGQASEILSISVIRSLGRLLTDGDQALVGLSHQNDLLTTGLADDPDDFLDPDRRNDLWWVHGLSETDHVQDRLDVPEVVAGPQTIIFFNSTGAVCAIRMDVVYRNLSVRNLTEWALLKQLTSYATLE